jgi:hypothetical protein
MMGAYHIWGIALGDLNSPYLQSPKMGRTPLMILTEKLPSLATCVLSTLGENLGRAQQDENVTVAPALCYNHDAPKQKGCRFEYTLTPLFIVVRPNRCVATTKFLEGVSFDDTGSID